MSNLYRGHSIDASYQISVHFAKRFQRRRFQKLTNQKQELPATAMFLTNHEMSNLDSFLPNFNSFEKVVAEEKIFRNQPINQKQELPVAAMFVNGLELNEQSLQRTFQGCFLPSFDSFSQAVSEKKIFQKSTNQKQELAVAAIFVSGS